MLFPKIIDVSDKGQILIPVDLREAFGIKPKGKVLVLPDVKNKKIELKQILSNDIIETTFGMLKRKKGGKSMSKKLLEDRKQDFAREENKFKNFRKRK